MTERAGEQRKSLYQNFSSSPRVRVISTTAVDGPLFGGKFSDWWSQPPPRWEAVPPQCSRAAVFQHTDIRTQSPPSPRIIIRRATSKSWCNDRRYTHDARSPTDKAGMILIWKSLSDKWIRSVGRRRWSEGGGGRGERRNESWPRTGGVDWSVVKSFQKKKGERKYKIKINYGRKKIILESRERDYSTKLSARIA